MLFCKDCKHYRQGHQWAGCMNTIIDPVDGKRRPLEICCHKERADANGCGRDARFFEPDVKPWVDDGPIDNT